jgi:hypothetical protein
MKYLKLFEGFESNRISAILSFLNKKLNKDNADKFLGDLTRLARKYDFPLSTLSDKEIHYLPVNKALQVKEEAMNPTGIYAIKYWFSIEKGYLCQTGVGNKKMEFGNYEQFISTNDSQLTKDHLDYLTREYNLKGLIRPYDFDSLQSGDKVVMVCDDYFGGDNSDLVYGEIYYDEDDNHFFFFNNNIEGTSPYNGYRLPGYRYSWSLGRPGNENSDHCMIHKIITDNRPLRFNDDIKEEPSESVWDFNLPLRNNPPVELETWQSKYNETFKLAKEANFAIILFLDDVLVKDISKEEISKERKDMRKDALALMSSEDVKKANVKRYLEKLFDKLGIEKDKQELKNLNSVVKSTILGEYFLMLNFDSSFISRLTDFIRALYKVMSKDDEEYYFSSLVDIFKRIKRNRLDQSTFYTKNIKYIKSLEVDNSDKVNEILKIFLKIGKSVSDYFGDKEVNSIEDLKSIQLQLRMILDLSVDDIFYLSGFMSNLLASLDETPRDVERRILRTYSDEDYEKDIKKLEKLEVIINRDFLKK